MLNLNTADVLPIICLLVFITNGIVEGIKRAFKLKGDSNNLIALITAEVVTICAFLIYLSQEGLPITWQYLILAIALGFIVALVAMLGWDKVLSMWVDANKGGGNNGRY